MSSRDFRSLNRAYKRGHITPVEDQQGRVSMHRKVKSDKQGAGSHDRWVKGIHFHYRDGKNSGYPENIPQKWARV